MCSTVGWRWLEGAMKLDIPFAKETYKRDAILQKRPMIHLRFDCMCSTVGWRWLVGAMKLDIPFAKEPYKRDAILQKRPMI